MKTSIKILCFVFLSLSLSAQNIVKDIFTGTGNSDFKNNSNTPSNKKNDSLLVLIKDNLNPNFSSSFIIDKSEDSLKASNCCYPTSDKSFFFHNKVVTITSNNIQKSLLISENGNSPVLLSQFDNVEEMDKIKIFVGQNKFFFTSRESTLYGGQSLWISDGTQIGTVKIGNYNNYYQFFRDVIIWNDKLYYIFQELINGQQVYSLYRSDENNTVLIKSIERGEDYISGINLTLFNDKLYFNVTKPNSSRFIFESDGTSIGTKQYYPGIGFGESSSLKAIKGVYQNNLILLRGSYPQYIISKLDTASKTVTDLIYNMNPDKIFNFQNEIYFLGYLLMGNSNTLQLHKYTNNNVSTNLVFDFGNKGINSNEVYFLGNTKFYLSLRAYNLSISTSQSSIYVSNGTTLGTYDIASLNPNLDYKNWTDIFGVIDDNLYFKSYAPSYGNEIWKTNGNVAGTSIVMDLNKNNGSSNPTDYFAVANELFFMADNGSNGRELWRTDGQSSNTIQQFDWTSGNGTSSDFHNKDNFGVLNNKLIYIDSKFNKLSLFDPITNISTIIGSNFFVKDPSQNFKMNQYFRINNNKAFFAVGGDFDTGYQIGGNEPWVTDGTASGTFRLKDIYPGFLSSLPHSFEPLGSTMMFFTENPQALWKSDGTQLGTELVGNLPSNAFKFVGTEGKVVNNKYFFTVINYNSGNGELWTGDLTTLQKIADTGASQSEKMLELNKELFYLSYNQNQIWKSNATTSGTVKVLDYGFQTPKDLLAFNNNIYFTVAKNTGTFLVKSNGQINNQDDVIQLSDFSFYDIQTSKISISSTKLIMTVFKRDTQSSKTFQEVWESDGTTNGTKKIFELSTTLPFSYKQEMAIVGTKLYFNGYDDKSGNELYVLDFSCPNNIVISNVIENNATYRANSKIEMSSEIKAISNVNLEANNQIILKPGTNISSNNVFKAEIRNCGN